MKAMHLTLAAAVAVGSMTGAVTGLRAQGSDGIRPDIQKRLYSEDMLDPQQPVETSVYHNWKSTRSPPWVIGYASSYAGNTWRTAALERLQNELLPKWKQLGLVKDIVVTQSELNDSLQSDQIRQLVDKGADAIILCCSNPTGLNEAIRYAYEKGVPTFSFTGYLTSKYAVNSSVNYQLAGYKIGEWMANEIGKKGNVLVVEGIPGTSASDSQDRGIKEALANYPRAHSA
jgi:ribose transport system substrate-binding protein